MIAEAAQAFLFDMDGTLISSVAATERVWGRWAASQGLDVPAFLRTIHGRRAVDVFQRLDLPGLDPEREAAVIAQGELEDVEGVVPIAGVERFLAAIPPDRWTIVTSAPLDLALLRLAKAGIVPPDNFVSAADVTRGKPAPDGFLLAAERLGVDPRRCVVFEDAPAGIAAGEGAGAAAVVVVRATHGADAVPGPHPSILSYDELDLSVIPGGMSLRLRRPA